MSQTTATSYSTKITARCTPQKAFEALSSRVSEWWGDQDAPVLKKGDVFKVSWGEPWYQFEVTDYHPNEKIVWTCIDAHQIIGDLEDVEKEWVGTQLVWHIKPINANQIEIDFTHQGLVPAFICYDFCSNTWDRFITFNLKKFLEE